MSKRSCHPKWWHPLVLLCLLQLSSSLASSSRLPDSGTALSKGAGTQDTLFEGGAAGHSSRVLKTLAGAAAPLPQQLFPLSQVAPICQNPENISIIVSSTRIGKVKWKGWGTALAWFGNYIGGFSDDRKTPLVDLLFNKTSGLGLNIVRFNIGGGFLAKNSPQFTKNNFYKWRGMPGYRPDPSKPYDWTQDANQRSVLLAAKARGADTFVAFANSAPYWQTLSGDVAGNKKGASNLKPTSFQDFANYLADVVQHYSANWSVNFQYLEPFNEPTNKWSKGGSQEGCSFTQDEAQQLIPLVYSALQARGLKTSLVFNDDWSDNLVAWANGLSSTLLGMVDHFDAHGYELSTPNQINDTARAYASVATMAAAKQKETWLSEWGPLGAGVNSTELGLGLYMSRMIVEAVNIMKASAWVYWQPIDPYPFWGMINIPWDSSTPYSVDIGKKYYFYKHFTTQVAPGSYPIDVSAGKTNSCPYCVAGFYNPCLNQLTVLVVNQEGTNRRIRLQVQAFKTSIPKKAPKFTLFRTSATENAKSIQVLKVSKGGAASFVANAYSLTSVVGSNIMPKSGGPKCPK